MKTLLLATSVLLSSSALALESDHTISQIDIASNSKSRAELSELAKNSTGYAKAYAHYRIAILANISGQRSIAKSSLKTAAQTLEQLNESESDSENYALLSAVYGMQIAVDPMEGMTLGRKSAQAIKTAESLDATNPRVYLVKAISAYNTPAMFGGSMENTIKFADKALSLYSDDCTDICWGKAETYTWRGLAKQQENQQRQAIADWKQAISVNPNYSWAKFLLSQNQ
ncbi:tetratricopeptide repeat protein [Parashewanella tropica]|uniref:tetratricopeptide repeat protein n=1 Tax=Parashewanella tropica TaxID=2547970 RepID=UPI00105A7051|nr:tetratricopeptide repeat protein [Parashewanella tropica]